MRPADAPAPAPDARGVAVETWSPETAVAVLRRDAASLRTRWALHGIAERCDRAADVMARALAARADGAHDPARVVAWLDEAGEAADGEPTDDAWYLHAAARMLALERARAERAEGRCEHAERAFAAEHEAREEDRAKYEVWRRNDIDVWRAEIERERQRAERAEAALREVMPVVELMGAAYIARYHHGEDSDEYVEALNEALSLSIGLVQYAREDTAARPPAAPQAGGDDA